MKVVIFLLFLFSCGPQPGQQERQGYNYQGQAPSNPGGNNPPPHSPGTIPKQDSMNYLQGLENQWSCGERWREIYHSTNFDLTKIGSIQPGALQGAKIQKVYVGKSWWASGPGQDIIFVEQISDDGVNTKGMNITFSFCKQTFNNIYYNGRGTSVVTLSSIVLDSDANKTYSSVDSAKLYIEFKSFTLPTGATLNEIRIPLSGYISFSKIQ